MRRRKLIGELSRNLPRNYTPKPKHLNPFSPQHFGAKISPFWPPFVGLPSNGLSVAAAHSTSQSALFLGFFLATAKRAKNERGPCACKFSFPPKNHRTRARSDAPRENLPVDPDERLFEVLCQSSTSRPGISHKGPSRIRPERQSPHDSQWLRGIPLSPLSCPPHFEPTSSRPFYGCILRPVFSLRCRGLSRFLWQDATKMGLFPLGPAAVAQT